MKTILLVLLCTVGFIVTMCFIENRRTENINKINLEYQQALAELNKQEEEEKKYLEPVEEIKEEEAPKVIDVNIDGAVKNPGCYEVRVNAYLDEVISLAGGVTEEADISSYNLYFQIPSDMKIYIPKGNGDNKISINTADAETLDMLPGIGTVLATRIIEYRNLIGTFQSIDELRQVEGLGDNIFSKLKDHVKL